MNHMLRHLKGPQFLLLRRTCRCDGAKWVSKCHEGVTCSSCAHSLVPMCCSVVNRCGKSTFVDILAGKKSKPYGGHVFLNGHPRDKMYDLVTAYVPQTDVMPEQWTVEEAVMFNFMLRRPMPKLLTECDAAPVVELVLESLGLDNVKGMKIGGASARGISGGQRRRVTLARGLATGAHVLFCDEPTSGLSSTDAEVVIRRLKLISKRLGITFVVVIHQPKPEVAALFNRLILFAPDPGRVVYNGLMSEAFPHYESVGFPVPAYANPADHFIDMVIRYRGGHCLIQHF